METWAQGLIAILISAALTGLVALSTRAVKAEAKDAVDGVKEEVADVRLDLARNYVQRGDLEELKKDQKQVLRKITSLQIMVARHFGRDGSSPDVRETDIEG